MATKTINLIGAEVAVAGLDGAHAHIRNDGTEVIYISKTDKCEQNNLYSCKEQEDPV